MADEPKKKTAPPPEEELFHKGQKFLEIFHLGKQFTEDLLKENERLRFKLASLESRVGSSQAGGVAMGDEVGRLRQEIMRLTRGDFTEEEFQNLCHNFTPEDAERFAEGCRQYQSKLFGSIRSPACGPT